MSRVTTARVHHGRPVADVREGRTPTLLLGGIGLLLASLLWSYWGTLSELIEFWDRNQDYSVGMLVPFVAVFLVWQRRTQIPWRTWRPSLVAGGAALLLSQVARFAAIYYNYASGERLSIVLTIGAAVLLVGGWGVLRRLFWVLAFMLLMVPFPNRVHVAIAQPLQSWATSAGRFGLELLGYFVRQEGNVLYVDERTVVAVAEACSGLRMLTAFIVTAAVICFLIQRPAWHKVVLMIMSLPVAVLCNGIRVLATALFMYYAENRTLQEGFHDLAGYAMMPLAVLMLIGLLKLLALFSTPEPRPGARKTPPAPRQPRGVTS